MVLPTRKSATLRGSRRRNAYARRFDNPGVDTGTLPSLSIANRAAETGSMTDGLKKPNPGFPAQKVGVEMIPSVQHPISIPWVFNSL